MKYIRTKNGIIFSTTAKDEDIDKSIYIKVADTIEELVSRYIKIRTYHYKIYKKSEFEKIPMSKAKQMIADGYAIYGAIWVNGEHNEAILKSVAKMNDKGELELL